MGAPDVASAEGGRLRVCVVGAGLSGLVAAKTFHQDGHDVTVYERDGDIGGVWAPRRGYPGLGTQTPGGQYAFSDFPCDMSPWPSAGEVLAYLRAYAGHFGITPLIRFRSRVTAAVRRGETGWAVTVEGPDGRRTGEFDFLLVCNGTFDVPKLPKLPGSERFEAAGGVVRHSRETGGPGLFQDKRVVVVGYGKSAVDIATYAAGHAQQVHLVVRRPIWQVPKRLGGLLPVRLLCTSRLWESLMPRRSPGAGSPWRRLLPVCWRGLERLLEKQFRLVECGLKPEHRLADQLSSGLQVVPDGFFPHVRAGRIRIARGSAEFLDEQGVVLADRRSLSADLVVLATGYRQSLSFLAPYVRERVIDPEGRYRLYRGLLSPEVPGLAFVGYNASLFTATTSEVGARWLAAYAGGRLRLPGRDVMNRRIDTELSVGRATRPLTRRFTGIVVAPYTYAYLDQLLEDLGAPQRVGVRGFFRPFDPATYASTSTPPVRSLT
ncbi:flavin-containing monooxygenase [Streptomyces sp. NPDC096310]|uniref:flavin-containing monooxygenase n=1 Tax=Streptomyces sp. NPDC096310 TaxID=3366082 RepID=UPI0037FEF203